MRMTIFTIPNRRMIVKDHSLVFRHDWEGQDLYWVVPMKYVMRLEPGDEAWTVRISDAYFAINTQEVGRRTA